MRYLNASEIDRAEQQHANHPVKAQAVRILKDLVALTNEHSDGWAYWSAPCRSARRLIELIVDWDDPGAEALKRACIPIKAMLTRYAKDFHGQTVNFGENAEPEPPRDFLAAVSVRDEDDARSYSLGTVWVDRACYTTDTIGAALDDLWDEWRESVPHPDSDAEFIDWLTANKAGFSEPPVEVVFCTIKV